MALLYGSLFYVYNKFPIAFFAKIFSLRTDCPFPPVVEGYRGGAGCSLRADYKIFGYHNSSKLTILLFLQKNLLNRTLLSLMSKQCASRLNFCVAMATNGHSGYPLKWFLRSECCKACFWMCYLFGNFKRSRPSARLWTSILFPLHWRYSQVSFTFASL